MRHLGAELDRNLGHFLFRREEGGLRFERKVAPPAGTKRTPREYWLQMYVAKCFRSLGFSSVRGPFDVGPDFEVRFRGRWMWAEVETTWRNFVRHGHHLDSRFSVVHFLITLDDRAPLPGLDKRLPPKIIEVDRDRFAKWYRPEAKTYADSKEVEARMAILANEIHSRFLHVCPDRQRDAAACPECDVCPYFPGHEVDPSGGARRAFDKMALMFVARRKSNRPRLASIKSEALDAFFVRNLRIVLGEKAVG